MKLTVDLLIKIIVIILFLIWKQYWRLTEKVADREKPKKKPTLTAMIHWYLYQIYGVIIFLQLLGFVTIFPFQRNLIIQLSGLFVVTLGIALGIMARKTLSTNWTHATEYQIKKNHELITSGIYSYIRHPIYTCMILAYTGAELVLNSYLFVIFLVVLFITLYIQAKKEETLLRNHFGKKYEEYMKKTKMFIPFVI